LWSVVLPYGCGVEDDVLDVELFDRVVVGPGGVKLWMQYCSSDGLVSEDSFEASVDR